VHLLGEREDRHPVFSHDHGCASQSAGTVYANVRAEMEEAY
jgi:hypothetical protein